MISKLLKYGIYSVFFGMFMWIGIHVIGLLYVFPDWRINTLCVSCFLFILVIAIKRGVWH